MIGMLCAPIVFNYKKGNIYCTLGKTVDTGNSASLIVIRLGVSTEMTSSNKRKYAINYFNERVWQKYEDSDGVEFRLFGSHIGRCLPRCRWDNCLNVSEETFYTTKPKIGFCVLTGFELERDQTKTVFENGFAHIIAEMAKLHNSEQNKNVVVLCGSYKRVADTEAIDIVKAWMKTKNIFTIVDFMEYVSDMGETNACYDKNLKFI